MAEISKDLMRTYASSCFGVGSLTALAANMQMDRKRLSLLMSSLEAVKTNYEKYARRVEREFATNNWLKMQGKPMRRKGS